MNFGNDQSDEDYIYDGLRRRFTSTWEHVSTAPAVRWHDVERGYMARELFAFHPALSEGNYEAFEAWMVEFVNSMCPDGKPELIRMPDGDYFIEAEAARMVMFRQMADATELMLREGDDLHGRLLFRDLYPIVGATMQHIGSAYVAEGLALMGQAIILYGRMGAWMTNDEPDFVEIEELSRELQDRLMEFGSRRFSVDGREILRLSSRMPGPDAYGSCQVETEAGDEEEDDDQGQQES